MCVCVCMLNTCGLDFPHSQIQIPEVSETFPRRKGERKRWRTNEKKRWRNRRELWNSVIYRRQKYKFSLILLLSVVLTNWIKSFHTNMMKTFYISTRNILYGFRLELQLVKSKWPFAFGHQTNESVFESNGTFVPNFKKFSCGILEICRSLCQFFSKSEKINRFEMTNDQTK